MDEEFQSELEFIARETSTSKSALVALMKKIGKITKGRTDALAWHVAMLEGHQPLARLVANSLQSSGGSITVDRMLGISQVGGTPFDLLMSFIFNLVKSFLCRPNI